MGTTGLDGGSGSYPLSAARALCAVAIWEEVRKGNLILLGHNEANEWLDRLLKKYPLRLTPTEEGRQRSILNTQPAPGEPPEYTISYSSGESDADQEYALISMIPGLEGVRQLALICGLNTQATQIARVSYVTTPPKSTRLLHGVSTT